ncbi:RNA polymerase factor sigma-54 [Rubrivirga marina]|uniref:RNA polymerase sigma-54 factor n=1 Tax=Rubrivirga marina TaxID=1196024 RepID=A0A271IXV6_9BACT|nr:RNA polymerase factor sigma-54 [Rubrivirga marina]PAP76032.1 RNA polymerase sigma-54 factor [Rubrivirga marina]
MLNLQQKQSLQQKLSPQQIQYIKLLQLPTLALEQRIKAELESNPLLEEGEEEDDLQLDNSDEPTDDGSSDLDDDLPSDDTQSSSDDEFDWDEFLNAPDDLYGYKAQVDHSAEEDDRESPMPALSSLAEGLREQVGLLDLDETEELVADQIIGSIDEDGYLRRPVESILDDVMFNYGVVLTEDDVERVLSRIQRLDPVGIAARDLRECLLIQLDVLGDEVDGRENAIDMLRDCYKPFTMKHFDAIKRKLNLDDFELKEAYDLVRSLDPKPGEGDFATQTNYITPDFTVERDNDDFRILLNGRNAPELRVSRHYRNMWNDLSAKKTKGDEKAKETKDFLKTRMESARWFINSIQQRRNTLLRVMEAIVEVQHDFFEHGEGHLKPMILKDIADIIHMDISTVSRVVNGKYVQTEYGVYELKHFFSEGITSDEGEEVSNKEVKALLERIIAKEDKTKPYSDQKLADLLAEEGFPIARRTVTKYREQLNVPVARLRKQIVLA